MATPAPLSPREYEVARLIARGLSNADIAGELTVEVGTVNNHVAHILRKLGVSSRVQVATWVLEHARAEQEDRAFLILSGLQTVAAGTLADALTQAAQIVAEALRAEKADTFMLDPGTSTLVALGTSDTPMGHRQRALGLHVLPLANGGRTVQVFLSGEPFLSGELDQDEQELPGIRGPLGVRSTAEVPLDVAGQRRGVLTVCSGQANYFGERDLRLLGFVAHWVGLLVARAGVGPSEGCD